MTPEIPVALLVSTTRPDPPQSREKIALEAHYGIPYGVVGVAMAFALGWLLARSMVETRGLFWAWFIHFCQDVIIFSFLAIGSITPGGA